jgi:UDP-GlcNAc3NAcA epimerase
MKIVTILGARPQFIKASVVSRAINNQFGAANLKEIIVHTGQHYDTNMSDIFFKEMQIPKPNYFLGIGNQSHGAMTGRMIQKIEEILINEKPDWVMVYGDTNSTLAGAIAASKLHIRIAHVESGLRSFNMFMPEEINRILTDRVSSLLFCPTQIALDNLKSEGIYNWKNGSKVLLTGDVMQDATIFYKNFAKKPKDLEVSDNYVLCTIHRAENTDNAKRLTSIFESLNAIAQSQQVIIPMHPRTQKIIQNLKLNIKNLTIIEPIGYLNMLWLIDNSKLVMTDSGGLQKEAYFHLKPCITLRDETEWVELVDAKVNFLTGADKVKISQTYKNISVFNSKNTILNLYGEGKASEKIVNALLK